VGKLDVSFNLSYLRYCHHLLLYIRVIKEKKDETRNRKKNRRTERREVGEGKETKWITGRVSS